MAFRISADADFFDAGLAQAAFLYDCERVGECPACRHRRRSAAAARIGFAAKGSEQFL